jgi:hypothetical protein
MVVNFINGEQGTFQGLETHSVTEYTKGAPTEIWVENPLLRNGKQLLLH